MSEIGKLPVDSINNCLMNLRTRIELPDDIVSFSETHSLKICYICFMTEIDTVNEY